MTVTLLIALTCLACGGFAWQSLALRRARALAGDLAERGSDLRERVHLLEQELGALCSASVGAGEHLVKMEQQVRRITERQDQLEMRAGAERPYSRASELVNRGAGIDELVERCGLTRGEAELLVMMQRGAA
jgi:hypothetical protein